MKLFLVDLTLTATVHVAADSKLDAQCRIYRAIDASDISIDPGTGYESLEGEASVREVIRIQEIPDDPE